ncbi:MAG TPA: uroporphyrinogen-III synthase [Gammaproteobacteria bacterium]|nr:uroporphyrinogen-III synthase [Gammaproteobacteria bacterium]
MIEDDRDLSGLTVLVTRPAHQAAPLAAAIAARGARVLQFPVLEISAPADSGSLDRAIETLEDYDWAIFISVNAVERALPAVLERRAWPASVGIAAIGRSSAEALEALGQPPDLVPGQRFCSEGLLELAPMQDVAGQRIVIFRGNGGREFLADSLRERGAEVEYVECYRRGPPAVDRQALNDAGRASDLVVVNSGESLRNLCDMAGEAGRDWLPGVQLVVASDRMTGLARELGFEKRPVVAANATNEAIVDALLAWRRSRA